LYNKAQLSSLIKSKAIELCFSKIGISKATDLKAEKPFFKNWLNSGYNADMQYLENNFNKRFNPSQLVENAKSIISVALNYYPKQLQDDKLPVISKYAYGRDYHKVMKKMLKTLADYINELTTVNYRIFVDSAPVLDKKWAELSGLGWVGKHSLLINKDIGSFFFIGEIILDLELEYDKPIKNYCGKCTACIDACPTNAIVSEKVVDANKCISYQTIENKNEIDIKLKGKFENRIFGCDICQDVCPWNKNPIPTLISDFDTKPERINLSLSDWENLTEEEFEKIFNGTALRRAGYKGLKRNAKFLKL
jgi:epoxyqueuosine reductase